MIETRIAMTRSATRPLPTRRLRWLTLNPHAHPRAQPHLSAASGLVCTHGRAYVIADDEQHLAVFRDLVSGGELHRILPGDLPIPKPARKRLKADLETLLLLPRMAPSKGPALVALGSGSRPNRNTGVVIPLTVAGAPANAVRQFDLQPLYGPLREALGEINIEGAMLLDDHVALLNRSVASRSDNALARYPLRALLDLIDGKGSDLKPASIQRHDLGALDDVPLGFTDAAALPGGGWVFSAVAEDTTGSYADGRCVGSVLGVVSAQGDVAALHRPATPVKVEGIALRVTGRRIDICMVTDADDPACASALLLAQL